MKGATAGHRPIPTQQGTEFFADYFCNGLVPPWVSGSQRAICGTLNSQMSFQGPLPEDLQLSRLAAPSAASRTFFETLTIGY
jgi:hypothetical protein